MRQQRFHLAAEVLIPSTRLPDQFASAAFFHLQGGVKDLFDSSPALTLHQVSLRSVRAAARPRLTSSPASQFRVKPSRPPRFPLRSGLQKKRISTTEITANLWKSWCREGEFIFPAPKTPTILANF